MSYQDEWNYEEDLLAAARDDLDSWSDLEARREDDMLSDIEQAFMHGYKHDAYEA